MESSLQQQISTPCHTSNPTAEDNLKQAPVSQTQALSCTVTGLITTPQAKPPEHQPEHLLILCPPQALSFFWS